MCYCRLPLLISDLFLMIVLTRVNKLEKQYYTSYTIYHCQFQGPSEACQPNLIYRRLNDDAKKNLLDKHNELRRKVAKGEQDGQPPAANMRKMVWNMELEEIAQRWADQCIHDHDPLRWKKDSTRVGQNDYISTGSKESLDTIQKSMGNITELWFNEVIDPGFDLKDILKFRQVFHCIFYVFSYLLNIQISNKKWRLHPASLGRVRGAGM